MRRMEVDGYSQVGEGYMENMDSNGNWNGMMRDGQIHSKMDEWKNWIGRGNWHSLALWGLAT
jgi:hypothetical protein